MNTETMASKVALRHGVWLAVCDGTKALLLENEGDHAFPKFETRETMIALNPSTHEQGSAKPGRAFNSVDGRRAAVEETDLHVLAEEKFIKDFAGHVERKVQEVPIQSIVLIAPARALGILRACIGSSTRRILAGSLARDYVHQPLYEIERHLKDLQSRQEM
jgi:protein required for attachment to host cells